MGEPIIQRAFAAGELAPALYARADQVKYTTGLRTCRNFLVRREGGVANRAGFRFVEACKTDSYGTRLWRFSGSGTGESYLIEAGAGYLRFFTDGGALVVTSAPAYGGGTAYFPGDVVSSGGTYYRSLASQTGVAPPGASWTTLVGGLLEIPTPYTLETLPNWNQSGNVITLTSPSHPPMELIFVADTQWVLREVETAPGITPPINVVAGGGAAGAREFKFIVTSAAADSYEESIGSAVATVSGVLEPTPDVPLSVTWDLLVGAGEYYVYCDPFGNGVYGYVGTAAVNAFAYSGETPDFNLTPPLERILFDAANLYPTCSSVYQQRRFFANTGNSPDAIYGSRTGFVSNYNTSSPLQDDDSITFRLAGNNHHPIRQMVAMAHGLALLTDGGEWTLTGGAGPRSPITPSSIDALQETYVGCSTWARALPVGSRVIYVQARGTVLRDLQFEGEQADGLAGRDLTIYSSHLFERKQIYFIDFQQNPHSIVWCVGSNGQLLGCTYLPEEELVGWHRHDTDGLFEDVCVVPEEEEDVLYVIVRRTIGGVSKRYIERLERRDIEDGFVHATSFFVDSGLSYSGVPADTFAGLEHLEGERVAVVADGEVLFDGSSGSPIVNGGTVQLAAEYSNVHIGLPYTAEIETLDLDVQGTAVRDRKKRIISTSIVVERSSRSFQAGMTSATLRTYEPAAWESTADLNTDTLELAISPEYNKAGRLIVRQAQPLPLTILAVVPNVEMGG